MNSTLLRPALHWRTSAQAVCLSLTGAIAASVLLGWLLSAVGTRLPDGWSLMKANTALSFLLAIASLLLVQPRRSRPFRVAGILCALSIMLLAASALAAYWTGNPSGVETLLASDAGATLPGRMSIQTAIYVELLGALLAVSWPWQAKWGYASDIVTMALVLIILSIVAGHLFGAVQLFGQTPFTRVAPQTLTCMALVAVAVIGQRTGKGLFSAFIGRGIGAQTARLTLPFALVMPFVIVAGSAFFTKAHWMSAPYSAAFAASTFSTLLFIFVLLMARRINQLESALRDASLTDELTSIANRRAFYLLGEQALHEAHRRHQPLTILFFDLNGLKAINDTFGHDAGSRVLREAAALLKNNFRGNDVIARIGGDEFAVAARGGMEELLPAIKRLDLATAVANGTMAGAHRISFSMGNATSEAATTETFLALVDRADALMYERKRHRQSGRAATATMTTIELNTTDFEVTGVMAAYVAGSDGPIP
jgi:diguanylate cyclase (GGDEF)-like protein